MQVHFGDLAIDCETRQLLRGAAEVPLGRKAFDLLSLLLRHRPRVVTKEKIRDELWASTFVSESTVLTVVADLRTALRDDPKRPRFIRTVRGFGYAFCGEVRESAAPVRPAAAPSRELRLILADREIALHQGENLLGRVKEGVAWIESQWVSRRHARIVVTGEAATLEDLGSKNGTFLRGRKISGPDILANGDEIRLGRVAMTFRIFRPGISTLTGAE
jgi:DNA-binding winged helix-turn-helix (wHTH) protein